MACCSPSRSTGRIHAVAGAGQQRIDPGHSGSGLAMQHRAFQPAPVCTRTAGQAGPPRPPTTNPLHSSRRDHGRGRTRGLSKVVRPLLRCCPHPRRWQHDRLGLVRSRCNRPPARR